MLLGLCCAIVANLFALLTPWVLKYAVDDLTAAVTRAKLGRYALALLAISAGGGIFRYFMRRLIIGVSRRVEYDLRSDFFSQLQRFPREYFDKARTGDLMSRASADLGAVRMMAGPAAMYAVSTGVLAIAAVGMMLWIDTRLTLLIVTFTPLVSLMVKYFGQAIHTRFERIQAQLAEISAITQEALAGVRVVRAYGQEAAERAKFLAASDEYVARNRKLILLQASFSEHDVRLRPRHRRLPVSRRP